MSSQKTDFYFKFINNLSENPEKLNNESDFLMWANRDSAIAVRIGETLIFKSRSIMATQKVTVELPEPVFRQLVRIASATDQPLEVLAAQSIASNLPPSADNAPLEMQADLLRMQALSIEELIEIAHSQVPFSQQQRHVKANADDKGLTFDRESKLF